MDTFDLDREEANARQDTQIAPAASPQVQYFQNQERHIAGKITLISLQLRSGATDAQMMLNDVQNHIGALTQFIGHQNLLLEAALVMQKQYQQEVASLEAERDDAMETAQEGYDTGFAVGYDQAVEDLGGTIGDGVETEPEFTRHEIEVIDLSDRLTAAEERNQELEAEIEQARNMEAMYAQMATELAAANETLAKWEAWYAENAPKQKAG